MPIWPQSPSPTGSDSIFTVPVFDDVLVYAPLKNIAALVNRRAAQMLQVWPPQPNDVSENTALAELLRELAEQCTTPVPRQGNFVPTMLGILPTRGCNFACQYCGFLTPNETNLTMSRDTARAAVDWYMNQVRDHQEPYAKIHFFGGEPFYAPHIVEEVVELARKRARELHITVVFEVTTNGAFGEARCAWVGANIDSVVLSFDGPADIQNLHRPFRDGKATFNAVYRTAKHLSASSAQLCLRACVTQATVSRMPDIAAWFCQEFSPAIVSFEPVQTSPWSQTAQLQPPDPWEFARRFVDAARVLEAYGVPLVYAAADTTVRHVTFCPVGDDAAIVAPDGSVNACYLLPREWEAKGLDLQLGQITSEGADVKPTALDRVRRQNVLNKPFCEKCFCKWHCAGGCHVNHTLEVEQGQFDRLCIQARIITLYRILRDLDQEALALRLLNDLTALERVVWQSSDVLEGQEFN